MASEITYAEVSFNNEFKSSGTDAGSPAAPNMKTTPHPSNPGLPTLLFASLLILLLLLAISFFVAFIIFFQKYSQLLEEKRIIQELNHTELECIKDYSLTQEKVWSCCPKNWKSFSSHCYFVSTDTNSWKKSQESCISKGAHLLVIDSKEEQDFIMGNLDKKSAYYVGLSDPEGLRLWQWVDQTPYNESTTFWHSGEPSSPEERCVTLNHRSWPKTWGWNDVPCNGDQRSVCEMKIYL